MNSISQIKLKFLKTFYHEVGEDKLLQDYFDQDGNRLVSYILFSRSPFCWSKSTKRKQKLFATITDGNKTWNQTLTPEKMRKRFGNAI